MGRIPPSLFTVHSSCYRIPAADLPILPRAGAVVKDLQIRTWRGHEKGEQRNLPVLSADATIIDSPADSAELPCRIRRSDTSPVHVLGRPELDRSVVPVTGSRLVNWPGVHTGFVCLLC